MNAKEFFELVADMRVWQKQYFRTRDPRAKDEAIAREKDVFSKLNAWIQRKQEARAERRHRRALIQEDRRMKRDIRCLALRLCANPPKIAAERPKISSLVYNISINPPKISKSAREQIGLGRKFELVVKERKRIQDGEVVTLTLRWKSPRKPPYSFHFDIVEPADGILATYLGGGGPRLPLKENPWPGVGIIPRTEPLDIHKELERLREIEESQEGRAARKELVDMIFKDVEEQIKAQQERLGYFIPGLELPNVHK